VSPPRDREPENPQAASLAAVLKAAVFKAAVLNAAVPTTSCRES